MVDFELDFWFCAVGLNGFRGGFWVNFGGGLARGGLQGGSRWVCGVARCGGFHFWSIPVVLGVGFFLFFCFTLLQTHNVKYLLNHFPRMQTNTGKTIIFSEIIYICKHFTVENNLHRNKRNLSRLTTSQKYSFG